MMLTIAKFTAALAFVISLILILAFVARKCGLGDGCACAGKKPRRLKLVESLPLDARRRAVLIRCDGSEHLILLGATSEILISSKDAAP